MNSSLVVKKLIFEVEKLPHRNCLYFKFLKIIQNISHRNEINNDMESTPNHPISNTPKKSIMNKPQ